MVFCDIQNSPQNLELFLYRTLMPIKCPLSFLNLFHSLLNWRTEKSSKNTARLPDNIVTYLLKGKQLWAVIHPDSAALISRGVSKVWGGPVCQWHMVPHLFPEPRTGWLWVHRVLLFPFDGSLLLNNKPKRFLKLPISPNCLHFQKDHLCVILDEGIV